MTPGGVVLDANVLYPAPLRDLLLQLAFADRFRAYWSDDITAEWTRHLRAARPDLGDRIDRTAAAMHRAMPDAPIRGYRRIVPSLHLPDPDDRHILAAAIVARAGTIVTFNIKDFPAEILAPYGIVAVHPDRFLISLPAEDLREAARQCRSRLVNPPVSPSDYCQILDRLGLGDTASRLGPAV